MYNCPLLWTYSQLAGDPLTQIMPLVRKQIGNDPLGEITGPFFAQMYNDFSRLTTSEHKFWSILEEYLPSCTPKQTQSIIDHLSSKVDQVFIKRLESQQQVEEIWKLVNRKATAMLEAGDCLDQNISELLGYFLSQAYSKLVWQSSLDLADLLINRYMQSLDTRRKCFEEKYPKQVKQLSSKLQKEAICILKYLCFSLKDINHLKKLAAILLNEQKKPFYVNFLKNLLRDLLKEGEKEGSRLSLESFTGPFYLLFSEFTGEEIKDFICEFFIVFQEEFAENNDPFLQEVQKIIFSYYKQDVHLNYLERLLEKVVASWKERAENPVLDEELQQIVSYPLMQQHFKTWIQQSKITFAKFPDEERGKFMRRFLQICTTHQQMVFPEPILHLIFGRNLGEA